MDTYSQKTLKKRKIVTSIWKSLQDNFYCAEIETYICLLDEIVYRKKYTNIKTNN